MALPMVPIFTQTVGAGGASSITFNNIPQFYTDLKLIFSGRSSTTAVDRDVPFMYWNGTGANSSSTRLYGIPTVATGSDRTSGMILGYISTATNTSNTFGNQEIYIPNYASSNFKSYICDGVSETNASYAGTTLTAGVMQSTSPISSITIIAGAGSYVQYSTFSLYGILRAGA